MTTARRNVLVAAGLAALVAAVLLWAQDGGRPPGARVRTILLITADTLRRDHVSAYAPPGVDPVHPRTPHMDALAGTSLRFDDARTCAPLTLPAHATMLTGLPPARTGVRVNSYGRLPPPDVRGFPLLQERLKEHGWDTAAFLSAAVLGRRYGLDQGFDHYDDGDLRDLSETTVPERAGSETLEALFAWLDARTSKAQLFLWVHFFEPHAPYVQDGTYAGDVLALDEVIGELMRGLRERGFDDAAILLAADHGEALGELGERTHAVLLADGVLRVPFLLHLPDEGAAVRQDPAELADIAPTLAAVAGVPWPSPQSPGCGVDLLAGPAPKDRPRVAESLYSHHLFRWAQLVSVAGPGGTLVDAGLERLHWVPVAAFQGAPFLATQTLPDDASVRDLANIIAQYKQSERAELVLPGQAAGGYGGGGPVSPFLTPEENARLPDPHTSIPRKYALDQVKAALLSVQGRRETVLRAQLVSLGRMARVDPENPELHFWIGRAHEQLASAAGDVRQLQRAEKAYLEAFRLGRKDTETLVRACGVNAGGREDEMLERLETLGKQLAAPGCQFGMLQARLLRKLGREAEAQAVCRAFEGRCNAPRDRALWERTCR